VRKTDEKAEKQNEGRTRDVNATNACVGAYIVWNHSRRVEPAREPKRK